MNTFLNLWKFLSPYLKPYKGRLIALACFPVVWCLVETLAPFLIKMIIDSLTGYAPESSSIQNALMHIVLLYMLLMLILETVIRVCNYVWLKTFPYIRKDIQSHVMALVQLRHYNFFYTQFSGDLVNKYRNLTDSFEHIFRNVLYGFYPAFLSFVFSLIFIAFINLAFSFVFLAWFLAMNGVTAFFCQKIILASQEQAKTQNLLFGYVGDFFGNVLSLVTCQKNLAQEKGFQNLQSNSMVATQQAELLGFKADMGRSVLSWLLLSSMIVFLGYGWRKGWVTLGDFSFIATVCFYVRRTIWMTSAQLSDFLKEIGAVKEALSLVSDTDPQNHQLPIPKKTVPLTLNTTIDLSHIRFGYNKDKPLFTNFNLHIPPGQKLGISGPSGVGKTSFIHLLLRIHDPDQGNIKINGKDYRHFPIEDLRNFFAYVPQNAILLHRSVFDNIALGNSLASPEDVYEAAKVCLCEEFIHGLEKGYDTIVGEGGYKLSGGQRQRIAIARAYLKKAPVLILDEATSGLNTEWEAKLLEQLFLNLKGHTFIVVSHRESSLKRMDRVVAFK